MERFNPLRVVEYMLVCFSGKSTIDLIPLEQVEKEDTHWRSTGVNPQFLLKANRSWQELCGWHWLRVKMNTDQPLDARLCFDTGNGFDPTQAVGFQIPKNTLQQIPLFVPSNCRAIRFDPCDPPARLVVSIFALYKTNGAPISTGGIIENSVVYEAMGGREGNAGTLIPLKGVILKKERDYCWLSCESDACFELTDITRKLRPGWYMIEMRIRTNIGRGNATLCIDYGDGTGQSDSVAFPFFNRRRTKRLYCVKSKPNQIQFKPLGGSGNFSIELLKFHSVSSISVPYRMLRRIRGRYSRYHKLSLVQVWWELKKEGASKGYRVREWLQQRYNETFAAIVPYSEWLARCETPEFSNDSLIDSMLKSFKLRPTISVIMPVFEPAEGFLKKAIHSVLKQSYGNWELCIADGASPTVRIRSILEDFARQDSRIKVFLRNGNGNISTASDTALGLATGEYVGLFDHDDELASHALLYAVDAINKNPSVQVVYTDEDKIDEMGVRSEPHFKPDWSPDLFFSQNYVCHLSIFNRELLNHIGGFRKGVEGSQNHDLLLRCLPHIKPGGIMHIPKVLYHGRMVAGSTALGSSEKIYTAGAGIKALKDHFKRTGTGDILVERGLVPNSYRVRYPIPQPEPLVSLLIPTRDQFKLLTSCVKSIIEKTTYQKYEVIIIDNQSSDSRTKAYFESIQKEDQRVRVLPYPHPFNFSTINNFGVTQAKGEVIGLINNDIEVISHEWLNEMVSHALRPEIGCVGAKLYYPDEIVQHAGVIVGLGGVAGHSHKYFPRSSSGYFHRLKVVQNLSAVTAACLIVRKRIYEEVGGFEENALKVAFNDVDFCLKVQAAGYRNLWTPYAELYHHESMSRGFDDSPEKIKRFKSEIDFMKTKWGPILRRDPFYSPNLTLTREDFSL